MSFSVGFTFAVVLGMAGCKDNEPLAPADAYLVYEPVAEGEAARSPAGLPFFRSVPLDDPRVGSLHGALAVGFASEALRTDYLVKQYVREASSGGHRYGPDAIAEAKEPTIFLLAGGAGTAATSPLRGVGFAVKGFLGRVQEHPHAVWVAAGATPGDDTALAQTLAGRLGRLLAARITATDGVRAALHATALEEALGLTLEVIAREWRTGEGPRGALAPDAGTSDQRARFADVRDNRCVFAEGLSLRPATELVRDPCVSATVLYRMVQSKLVGRKVAGEEVYAPYAKDRVPPGVSSAAVFGPVRNALVKLLAAWGRAVLDGQPPLDSLDLVRGYAALLPAEKEEALRLFVITTYGATVKEGGVSQAARDEKAAGALAALATEVATGGRSLTGALAQPAAQEPAKAASPHR